MQGNCTELMKIISSFRLPVGIEVATKLELERIFIFQQLGVFRVRQLLRNLIGTSQEIQKTLRGQIALRFQQGDEVHVV